MKRFIEGEDRNQITLFPNRLEEYVAEDNPVRVVDAFVDRLDLGGLGFSRVVPRRTGHPIYRCPDLLKRKRPRISYNPYDNSTATTRQCG